MRHKQIIPCNTDLYAVFKDEKTGELFKDKVLAFSLCDDDRIYPLTFDAEFGIGQTSCDDATNFCGYELMERKVGKST